MNNNARTVLIVLGIVLLVAAVLPLLMMAGMMGMMMTPMLGPLLLIVLAGLGVAFLVAGLRRPGRAE